ncbi:MAG TPA: outer membrane protein assembly factor BamD, partial [Planctomycetota bacterium]
GLDLLEGRTKVFWIFSDRSRGASVLINLATLSPLGEHSAEALTRVGEFHFEDEDWQEAIDDYQLILRYHANSEWADLATFRIGQAGYLSLDGYWVDARLARQSLNQLREYLRRYPSGLYRAEAETTATALEENLASYDLEVGDYYEDIGNVRGARYHYRLAAGQTGTRAAEEASARLLDLPPDPPFEAAESSEDD